MPGDGAYPFIAILGGGEFPLETSADLRAIQEDWLLGKIDVDPIGTKFKCSLLDDVIIGDESSGTFKPHAKLKRWGEECFISMGLSTAQVITPTLVGGRLRWNDTDKEIHFYGKPDAFEFDIILKTQPPSNVQTLDFNSQGLVYYYQPPLTEEFTTGWSEEFQCNITVTETQVTNTSTGEVLVHRPENVVGSYAVYHATRTNMHASEADAEKYKVGKAFHIYRPKAIDAGSRETWTSINITGNALTITIDQTWLNNATYPVIIDPEFGYHPAAPASSYAPSGCVALAGVAFIYTASTGDTITKFSIYGKSSGGTTGYDMAAYTVAGGIPVTRLAAGVTVVLPTTAAWTDSAAVSQVMSNGVVYCVACGNDGAATETLYYDSGTGNNESYSTNTGALAATWAHAAWYSDRDGIYCIYTAGGGGVTVTPTTLTLTLATFAPTVSAPRLVTPSTLALTLTTYVPTVLTPRLVTPSTLGLTLTTYAPTIAVSADRIVTPSTLGLVITTYAPTVTIGAGDIAVTPATLALILSTFAPLVTATGRPYAHESWIPVYPPREIIFKDIEEEVWFKD